MITAKQRKAWGAPPEPGRVRGSIVGAAISLLSWVVAMAAVGASLYCWHELRVLRIESEERFALVGQALRSRVVPQLIIQGRASVYVNDSQVLVEGPEAVNAEIRTR